MEYMQPISVTDVSCYMHPAMLTKRHTWLHMWYKHIIQNAGVTCHAINAVDSPSSEPGNSEVIMGGNLDLLCQGLA